jgi:hypothetical protein
MNQYPSDVDLQRIRQWYISDIEDFRDLMSYIENIWVFGDWGFRQDGDTYQLNTGGWSGNEEIIQALRENTIFWIFYWEQSHRGGHYVFAPIPKPGDAEGVYIPGEEK